MNKVTKHAVVTALGTTLLFSSVVPAIHAEQAMPEVSTWAIELLNEGEKYGVYPVEWYYEDFQKEISIERLNALIDLTEKKIATLNLPKNTTYKPAVVKGNNTRGDVINRLYNIVAQYDLDVNKNAVKHMQERQVLHGSGKDLMLQEKATTQHAVIFAIRLIKDVYAQVEQGAKGVAWIVEDEDTTIYLLGSIHLGIPDLYPMNKKLTDAFDVSQGLFVEANVLDPSGIEYYMEKALYAEGHSIQEDISPEAFAKLAQVAETLGMNVEEVAMQKPWLISNSLSLLTMNDTFGIPVEEMVNHGIDMQFLLSAMLQQKPIYELEGMEAQVDMFDSLSKEAQEEQLVAILDSIIEPSEQTEEDFALMAEWFSSWKTGDVATFAESLTEMEGDTSEYNQMLFGKRDEQMAAKIAEVLETTEGKYFVVVGAGHFLVDKNIRYHLEELGYKVKSFYE